MESLDKLGPRRGRPRKFMGPSRAVTLTLPDYVLDALGAIDPDLSRAVVRLTQPELAKQPHPPAELVQLRPIRRHRRQPDAGRSSSGPAST